MTEHENPESIPIPDPPSEADQTAGAESSAADPAESAWTEVVHSVEHLGKAVATWGASLKDDPKNRQRAEQLRGHLEGAGRNIGDAVEGVTKSDVAQDVGKAATSVGRALADTAKRVGDEVSPHVAGAFKSVAEGLREAAERIERGPGTTSAGREAAPGPHPSPEPAPYDGSEPPAPAPSGVHEDE